MKSRTTRPISWTTLVVVVSIVAAATATMRTHSLPSWMPPFWLDVGRSARESLLLVAPIIAAIGAWVGGWNHTIVIGPTPGRPQPQLVKTRVVPVMVAAIVGQWIGLLPAIIAATRAATWGTLPWSSVVAANAELGAAIGIGFLAGVVIRSRLAPVVAAVGVFVVIWLTVLINDVSVGPSGEQGPSVLSVAWTWFESGASPGSVDAVAVNLARIVLFGLVGAACFATAVAWPDTYRQRRGAAASLFVAPAALALVMFVIQPNLSQPIDAQRCEPVGTTPVGAAATVCVTPDVVASLEPTAAAIAELTATFGYGAIPVDVQKGGDLSSVSSGGFIIQSMSRHDGAIWMHDNAATQAARSIAGVDSCLGVSTDPNVDINPGGRLEQQFAFTQALASEIARRAVHDERNLEQLMVQGPNEYGMEAWTNDEMRQFIGANADRLSACSVSAP